MECNKSCCEFCAWIERMPFHVNYVLPKERYPMLPECFCETFLGEMFNGAGRQLRGPHGAHVHEFDDRWIIHRDRVNASEDPLGHLIKDAPEYLASVILSAIVGAFLGRHGRQQAILAASLAGTFAFVSGKVVKLLIGDPSEGDENAPKIG
jgi:hypothetical protein